MWRYVEHGPDFFRKLVSIYSKTTRNIFVQLAKDITTAQCPSERFCVQCNTFDCEPTQTMKVRAIPFHLRRCCQRRVDFEQLPPRVQWIRFPAAVSRHTFVRASKQLFTDLGTRWNERFGESSTRRTRHVHEKGAPALQTSPIVKKTTAVAWVTKKTIRDRLWVDRNDETQVDVARLVNDSLDSQKWSG